MVPGFLRPIVGFFAFLSRSIIFRKLENLLRPTFEKRLLILQSKDSSVEEPQDFLQHLMRSLHESNSPDLDIAFVTKHVVLFLLGAAFNTSMLATHVLYGILDSDAEYNTIAEVQTELENVFGEKAKHAWSRSEAEKLPKLDSILRETLRLYTPGAQNMARKVMHDGLSTPDGYPLPKGSTVTILARGPQMDPDSYPDPQKFVPFRHIEGKKRFVDTGPEFLPFGHGTNACPGRFLLAIELKMLVSYILQQYEVELPAEYAGKRPPAAQFGEFRLPPRNGKIQIRKRV